jgi:hypothetical protein
MVAIAFSPVEIFPSLSVIFGNIIIFFLAFVVVCFVWGIIFFRGKSSNAKKSEEELLKLLREWCENGTALSDWVRTNFQGSNLSWDVLISNPEFQELLQRDFEIYDKIVILDPKLKEDPIVIAGRSFYKSLVRTENQGLS